MDVVDERAQRSDAQASRHQQDVVMLHLLEGECLAIRPANADDVAALHLVKPACELARTANAQLDEAALRRRARDGDGRFSHAEYRYLHELARLVMKGIANALVDEPELEQLLGRRQRRDRRDARRPRAVGVGAHELGARFARRRLRQRLHLHRRASRHLRPLSR